MSHINSHTVPGRTHLLAVAVAGCFAASPAWSLPTGATVVNGTATLDQVGQVLNITNSNGAILNWQQFNIAAGEMTRFIQASASSSVLNRVVGGNLSAIYGALSSNGKVWLVNPAGILVGAGGTIDTAAFIASTLAIRNEDFLAGKLTFAGPGGNVVNQGAITTPTGGSVYLIGANVSNEGVITTPKGETILAAGQTVNLIDTATPGVKVEITGATGDTTNLGTIAAEAGRIGMAGVIVRNSGTLNATSAVEEGGRVFLRASQDTYVDGSGRIVATGTKGGHIEALGNRVAVMDNASLDASGANGGGKVLVGGDWQGKNPEIRNAQVSYVGADVTLSADATKVGDGGTVVVWADDTTRAYGTISARGGAEGGDGGQVETSGKRYLDVAGARVNTSAPQGATGSWLIDPDEIQVVAGNGTDVLNGATYVSPTGYLTLSGGVGIATVYGDNILANLSTTNVNLTTSYSTSGSGNITFNSGNYDFSTATNDLGLFAYGGMGSTGNIIFSGANLKLGAGAQLSMIAGWDGSTGGVSIPGVGSIEVKNNSNINAGIVWAHAGADIALQYGSAINGIAGNPGFIVLDAVQGAVIVDGLIKSYGGDVAISGHGVVIGNGTDSAGINARHDGVGPVTSVTAADTGPGGRIRIDAIDGTLTVNNNAAVHTSATDNLLAADGSLDPYGSPAIGIRAADMALGTTSSIRTSYTNYPYGGGDIAILPHDSASSVRLGNYSTYGGSFTLDNAELSRIMVAGPGNCSAGAEGCRIWIGNLYSGTDPVTGMAYPTTSQNFVLADADFTLNGSTAVGKRIQLATSGSITDEGASYGAKANVLGMKGLNGIGGASSFRFDGNSLSLASQTGNIDVEHVSPAGSTLALRGVKTDGGDASVSSQYGSITLIPFFSGQQYDTGGDLNLSAAQNLTFAGYGGSYSLGGGAGFTDGFTETAAFSTSVQSGGAMTLTANGNMRIDGPASIWSDGLMTLAATNIGIHGGSVFDGSGMAGVWMTSGGGHSITATDSLVLQAGSANHTSGYGYDSYGGSVTINTWMGTQTVSANQINLIAGADGHDNSVRLEGADQTINITGTGGQLLLQGGGDSSTSVYGGAGSFNNSAKISSWGGTQTINIAGGGSVVVRAGSGTGTLGGWLGYGQTSTGSYQPVGSNNAAGIWSGGGAQAINFASGGTLSIYGGTAGTNNYAWIGNGGTLAINGSPDIFLVGGTGGAASYNGDWRSNDASISSNYGTLDVQAGHLTIDGGGDATSYGGAGIGGGTVNIVTTGNVTLTGGASNATDPNDIYPAATSAASIGVDGSGTIALDIGGGLTLTGGTGTSGPAVIGTLGGAPTITIDVGGNVTLAAGNGPVAIGALGPDYGANVSINAGGNILLTGNPAAAASIGNLVSSSQTSLAAYGDIAVTDGLVFGGTMNIQAGGNIAVTATGNTPSKLFAIGDQTVEASGDINIASSSTGAYGGAYIYTDTGVQTVRAGGNLTLSASDSGHDNRASIQMSDLAGYGGTQTITAGHILLDAGGGTGSYNNSANLLAQNTASQSITLTAPNASLALLGGAGDGVYGGAVDSCKDGTGATLAACSNLSASNIAQITARGPSQTINFQYGGSLNLSGGSGGNNNQALIYNAGTGMQTISGAPDINLTAGSGGVYLRDIDYLLGNHAQVVSNGTQTIVANDINLTGGTSGVSRAQIYSGAGVQIIDTTGNVTLTGGGGSTVTSYYGGTVESTGYFLRNATGAMIRGFSTTEHYMDLNIGGNLLMQGGTGTSGIAFIGAWKGPVDFFGEILGNTTLNGNTGGALIGSATSATTESNLNSIGLYVGGALALTGGNNAGYGTAAIGSRYDATNLTIGAGSVALTASSAADAGIGSTYGGNATYGGSVTIQSAGNIGLTSGTAGGTARIGIGAGTGYVYINSGSVSQSVGSVIGGGEVDIHASGALTSYGSITATNYVYLTGDPVFIGGSVVSTAGDVDIANGQGTPMTLSNASISGHGGVYIGESETSGLSITNSTIAAGEMGPVSIWSGGATTVNGTTITASGTQAVDIFGKGPVGDISLSNTGIVTQGGSVNIGGPGNVGIDTISASTGSVSIAAGNAILDNNGAATNITASTVNLSSAYGGVAGGLAISTDVALTGSTVTATVDSTATYGGIRIGSTGAQPTSLNLADYSMNPGTVSFSQTGPLTINGINWQVDGGNVTLSSTGDMTINGSPSINTLETTGTTSINSGGNLLIDGSYLWVDGNLVIGAAGTATVQNSAYVHGEYLQMTSGGAMAITSGGEIGAWQSLTVTAGGGLVLDYGGMHADYQDASIATPGDIRLNNGSHIYVSRDAYLKLTGSTSRLYLNENAGMDPSYISTGMYDTIHLDFPNRTSLDGAVVIDGTAVNPATGVLGGDPSQYWYYSGLYVYDMSSGVMRVAKPGSGLALTPIESQTPNVDVVNTVVNTIQTVTQLAQESEPAETTKIAAIPAAPIDAPTQLQSKTLQTVGGTEGQFGQSEPTVAAEPAVAKEADKEEKKDDKKKKADVEEKKADDKKADKKVAQCS